MDETEHLDPPDDASPNEDEVLEQLGHPKGTLAIMAAYALLFILGWLGLWFLEFLPRGAPH